MNKFDKGVHTVEFKVSVNQGGGLGVEGGVGVEQHKWSKPFGAAVSSKLIPLSLIPDVT